MSKMICNPLDLDYKFQFLTSPMGTYSMSREAADPTVVVFKDKYLLFASMSTGFWYSDDLVDWKFKPTPELPNYDYAPDVRQVGSKVIFSASKHGKDCSLFASEDPINEDFEEIKSLFPFWDPDVYEDEDGKVYIYWGCSNTEPIYGIELDSETFEPIGEKVALISEHEDIYGWERKGENNNLQEPTNEYERLVREHVGTKPFIEGAYMNKHNGKYYLQYAAPGTESNVYADGVYIGDHPLGPFTYQSHNPFSSKPGGFITSAGHGSTFEDKFGNWWHVSTMRISVNQNFERRIGLFKCDFDEDGILYCNQNFADYPFTIPTDKRDDMSSISPELNLLSFNASVSVSSFEEGYEGDMAVDENIRTWWAAKADDINPTITIDFKKSINSSALQVNIAEHKLPRQEISEEESFTTRTGTRYTYANDQCLSYKIEYSIDGKAWKTVDLNYMKPITPHKFINFADEVSFRYLKLSQFEIPFSGVPAISGIRVFGQGSGEKPGMVENINFQRTPERLNIFLNWEAKSNADGYNIRYGAFENKLYNSWQVVGENKLDLSMINKDDGYFIAIDSYNQNGVTCGDVFYIE